jgi:hypothetical protein
MAACAECRKLHLKLMCGVTAALWPIDVCGHALVVIVAIVLLLPAFLTTAASSAGREGRLLGA